LRHAPPQGLSQIFAGPDMTPAEIKAIWYNRTAGVVQSSGETDSPSRSP